MKQEIAMNPAKSKLTESEKITINLGFVDLGQIDLLVCGGLLRQPLRLYPHCHSQPAQHPFGCREAGDCAQDAGAGPAAFQCRRPARRCRLPADTANPCARAWLTIAPDVTPELALATIASLDVLGALQASPAVKAALASRMR